MRELASVQLATVYLLYTVAGSSATLTWSCYSYQFIAYILSTHSRPIYVDCVPALSHICHSVALQYCYAKK